MISNDIIIIALQRNLDAVANDNILRGIIDPIDFERNIGQVIFDIMSQHPDHVSQVSKFSSIKGFEFRKKILIY